MFKFDPHVHTKESSYCGWLPGAEVVRLYKDAGFSGVCITDHYFKSLFDNLSPKSWEKKIDAYLKGYNAAKREGDKIGLNVILGAEVMLNESNNDYLVYGLTKEFLINHPNLFEYSMEEFFGLAKENNFLVYHAHPFRHDGTPQRPELLDGIEVVNACPRHDSRNHLAYEYAKKHNLKMIGGSDCHRPDQVACGGIIANTPITTAEELIYILNSADFSIIGL